MPHVEKLLFVQNRIQMAHSDQGLTNFPNTGVLLGNAKFRLSSNVTEGDNLLLLSYPESISVPSN